MPVPEEQLAAMATSYAAAGSSTIQPGMLKLAFSCIDLTTLNPTDTVSHVAAFTQKVNLFEREYPGLSPVAALCTYPNMVEVVKENLAVAGVRIAAVAGGFPSSMTFGFLKAEEARQAVVAGADEIDMVMPLWAFLEGNHEVCLREIKMVKAAIGEADLKVILETGLLKSPREIWEASLLALEAGAGFIKTSTGKTAVSATPEAVLVMALALKHWHASTGEMKGLKAAGGIVTSHDAMVCLAIVRDILGTPWLGKERFRIGASRLANNLLSDLLGGEIKHF